MDPPGLNAAAKLLGDTGRGLEASELLADFVRRRTGRMLAFTMDPTSDFATDHIDPELKTALKLMFAPPTDDRPAGEVFRTIASEGRWSDADIARLANQTLAQFEAIIEETQGDDLRKLVRLGVSMISAPGDEHTDLREKLGQAVKAISARSQLRDVENEGEAVSSLLQSASKGEQIGKYPWNPLGGDLSALRHQMTKRVVVFSKSLSAAFLWAEISSLNRA